MYELVKYDHPALSQVAEPVPHEMDVSELVKAMRRVLNASESGVGLAANQVGEPLCVIVVRDCVMINPSIVWRSLISSMEMEMCLSYPHLSTEPIPGLPRDVRLPFSVNISRSSGVHVEYEDEGRKRRKKIMTGLEARIVQHEIDHLQGVCLVGDAWRKTRDEVEIRVEKLPRKGE